MLATDSVRFLGYHIKEGLKRPQIDKVDAIRTLATPTTKKGIRAFLGLVVYYRRFIPRFSEIAAPLTDMLSKTHPNTIKEWSQEQRQSLNLLKDILCHDPVLRCLDYTKEFILQTDASDRGLGVVLSQPHADGNIHPVVLES